MTNNIDVPVAGGGTATLATDDKDALGVHWQRVQISGEQPLSTSGNIVASGNTVEADVTNMGNATITISGTYAGVSFVFEASDDAAATYFPLQAQREVDGTVMTGDTPAANASVMYLIDCPGITTLRVRATARTSGTAAVRINPGGMVAVPVVSIGNTGGATGTSATVTASTTAKTIQAANPGRRGLTVYNDSTAFLYVLLGAGTASTTVFSNKMQGGGYYEIPSGFTGIVTGVWSSATGNARVTEVTA